MRYSTMSTIYSDSLDQLNIIFAIIFNLECVLKIIGLGSRYFYKVWNLFDLAIILLIDLGLIMSYSMTNQINISAAVTVLRAFRIMRVFTLVKKSKNI